MRRSRVAAPAACWAWSSAPATTWPGCLRPMTRGAPSKRRAKDSRSRRQKGVQRLGHPAGLGRDGRRRRHRRLGLGAGHHHGARGRAPMSPAHRIDIAATHAILAQPARHAKSWSPAEGAWFRCQQTSIRRCRRVDRVRPRLGGVRRIGVSLARPELAREAADAAVGVNRHAALVLAARSALWARDAGAAHSLLDHAAARAGDWACDGLWAADA